ncbi:MAG: hypothetical protein JNL25_07980 [Rhodospirillaceae bacterium]|nr:hypothetical protein [Rhodospirillaceae bacterium]
MGDDLATDWPALLAAIVGRLATHPDLADFSDELGPCSGLTPIAAAATGVNLPVGRYWSAAIGGDPLGDLAARVTFALEQLGHGWRQNPNYRRQPPHPDFLENYGYQEWLGPDAAYRAAHLRCGVLVLGPRTLYPAHHHPAEEVYLPLGPGRWCREGEGWRDRMAGEVIHHPPECGHATESGDKPLAAIYLWRGAIAKAAEIA